MIQNTKYVLVWQNKKTKETIPIEHEGFITHRDGSFSLKLRWKE